MPIALDAIVQFSMDMETNSASGHATNSTAASTGVLTEVPSLSALVPQGFIILLNILIVVVTYFLVYFSLAVVRTKNYLSYGHGFSTPLEKVLESTMTYCVHLAPMLSVLFFEVGKRAVLLAGGTPPTWAVWSVCICSVAFAVQAIMYIVGEWSLMKAGAGGVVDRRTQNTAVFCRNLCNLASVLVYGSVFFIMVRTVLTMGQSAVPVGHFCTLLLAVTYMVVYLALFVLRLHHSASFLVEIFKHAAIAINFAPMLAVFFLGTQTVVDLAGSTLPDSTTQWMVFATFSVLLMVAMVIIAPICADAELEAVGPNGEADFVAEHNCVFVLFTAVRVAAMVVMYIGLYIIANALWSAGISGGQKVLMYALFYFGCLYFATYLALWLLVFADGFFSRMLTALKLAKDTVAFCPIFSVLFLTAFCEASPLVPQSYSQDFMLICIVAMFVQVAMILLAGILGKQAAGMWLLTLAFYIALVAVHVSVLVVTYGLFTINSDNATVDGAWFAS